MIANYFHKIKPHCIEVITILSAILWPSRCCYGHYSINMWRKFELLEKFYEIVFGVKKKLRFIDGNDCKPFDWKSNSMKHGLLLSWIINSVTLEIWCTIMHLDSTTTAWVELEERYKKFNVPKIYQIRYDHTNYKQKGMDANYYNKIKVLWDELDILLQDYVGFVNVVNYRTLRDEGRWERINQFVLGLDDEVAILRPNSLPRFHTNSK